MANKIQIKRGYAADMPTLDEGELGFTVDEGKLYAGNGTDNTCINSDPDSTLDDTSHNAVENAAVAKAINAAKKRISDVEEIVLTEYGMRWQTGASDPTAERVTRTNGVITAGASTGLTFTTNADGSFASSYDNIYPWSEITRVTLEGKTMVRVPRYYLKRETVDGYDYTWVCKEKLPGYRCAGIFLRPDGTENDYYYIGAYENFNSTEAPYEAGNEYSGTAKNFIEHREIATAIGTGWDITPIAEVCDFWWVILPIEFGTRDTQAVAAGVCKLGGRPVDSAFPEQQYRTGMCDTVPNLHGILPLCTEVPNNGANYNEQTGLNCGANPFIYRGIENPYGMLRKHIVGLTSYNGELYTCNDRSKYANTDVTNYTKVTIPYATVSSQYIKEIAEDANAPYCALPTEVTETSMIHFCDKFYVNTGATGYQVSNFGGYYNSGEQAGAWYLHTSYNTTSRNILIGSRLSYFPV